MFHPRHASQMQKGHWLPQHETNTTGLNLNKLDFFIEYLQLSIEFTAGIYSMLPETSSDILSIVCSDKKQFTFYSPVELNSSSK